MTKKLSRSLIIVSLIVCGSGGCDCDARTSNNATERQAAASQKEVTAEAEPTVLDVGQTAELDQVFKPSDEVCAECVSAPFPIGGLVKSSDTRVSYFVATIAGEAISRWTRTVKAYIVNVTREAKLAGQTNAVSLSLRR